MRGLALASGSTRLAHSHWIKDLWTMGLRNLHHRAPDLPEHRGRQAQLRQSVFLSLMPLGASGVCAPESWEALGAAADSQHGHALPQQTGFVTLHRAPS